MAFLYPRFVVSRGSLYQGSLHLKVPYEVRYIASFAILEGIEKFVMRFVISRASLYREFRYITRLCFNERFVISIFAKFVISRSL